MPGIVLTYNKKLNDVGIENICNDVSGLMYNYKEFRATDLDVDNKILLKLICRKNDYSGIYKSDEGFIAWYGRPLYKGKTIDGEMFKDIKSAIDKKGVNLIMDDLSGHFQLVTYIRKSHECYVICDKISTQPLYYVETDNYIIFSPEPLTFKALNKSDWCSSIRFGAVFEFMASGYLWGDECFLEGIKRVGPGQFICIGQDDFKIGSYWKMTFAPNKEPEQALITELFDAIQKDINDLPKGKKILALSGGYDSRALLGLFKAREQFNTVSYSFGSKANKGMDIAAGGYYAEKAGVSHSYYRASLGEPSRLIADINNAVLATGGENYLSIFQDAFLGIEFYRGLANNYDYIIRGDEVWGWGDLSINYNMAFWESRLFNLNEILQPKKIMKQEVLNNGIKYIEELRKKYIEECGLPNISANDLKDYLYWRHREARLLQSMAYFRRCYISHFAPFLFDRTLSVIRRTSSKHRVQKGLFMNMGRKMFPDLFLDNKVISPHSSDVNNFNFLYKDKKFRSFIKGTLLESSSVVFKNVFDRKLFEHWINDILDGNFPDVGKLRWKHDIKRLAIGFIGRSNYLKGSMKAFMVKNGMNTFPVLNVNYLFRLVVLALALHQYENN